MACAHVEHNGKVGLHHRAELIHVAGVADACFHDPEGLVAIGGHHRDRHAHLRVQVHKIAGRLALLGKDVGEQFLGGRLASRACNASHAATEGFAPRMAYAAKGGHAVIHEEHGDEGLAAKGVTLGQHGHSSGLNGGFGKIMAIHLFAGDSRKELAGQNLAVVGGRSGERDFRRGIGVKDAGIGGLGGLFQSYQHEISSLSIS